MKHLHWKKTITLNIKMLKLVGLWPKGNESYKYDFYLLYKIICILLFQFCYISTQVINLYYIKNNLEAVTGTIFLLLTEILVVLKSYFTMKNMSMLKKLMTVLDSDLFQPKTSSQMDLVRANFKSWKLITYTLWLSTAFWYFFWASFPLLDGSFKEYRFPCLSWFPYNVQSSPQYELTYFYHIISMGYLVGIHLGTDALIAALNMFIGAQIDILNNNLQKLGTNKQNSLEDFLHCVHHHREILKFAEDANRFYNWLLLGAFFTGGISIGLALFQLTVVAPFSSEFYSYFCYSGGFCIEVFLYCWFGNEIQVKSSKLLYATFECDWTDLSPEIKKDLIILSSKLQKPLQIFALGLFSLSLDTYMKILKTSYTYFTLLRNINATK